MSQFNYTAVNKSGKNTKGKVEASDKNAAVAILKNSGLIPINVVQENSLQKEIVIGKPVKVKDLTVFCQQFESILTAGISVLEALDLLREQTENKLLSRLIADIYKHVETGESLSGSMRNHPKYFPSILVNMIEAGEASGSLEIALRRMAEHFEKEYKIQQSVKKAVMYPIIVSVVMVIVVAILMVVVIPTFEDMFSQMGADLPITTRIMIGLSDFLIGYWYIIIAVIGVLVVSIAYLSKTEKGKMFFSQMQLKLPIIGKVTAKIISSRFTRTMSTLLAAGLPLLETLEIVAKVVDNYQVEKFIISARDQVSKGVPLSKPINDMGIFPPMVTHMVKIGENTGQLEPILHKVADFYDSEVETAVAQMTTLLEPLIIVVLAGVVGLVVVSIIQPMFSMYEMVA